MGKAYLVLANGKIFEGESFGAVGTVTAEVVFTTGMTGYLETLTDRSYYGQMVVQTFPLIGNYGVIPQDFESDTIGPAGYIVRDWCRHPSNFRSRGDLDTLLKEEGVIGISGIDTRTLTKIIRENGVMNGMITDDLTQADLKKIAAYKVNQSVESVSVKEPYTVRSEEGRFHVALIDYGRKENIMRALIERGCDVTVLPCSTEAAEIRAMNPDGILLSNGPGDPAENTEIIEGLKKLLTYNIPIFGICLGHQLLALANGFKTEKLKYGHRGANQPVKDLENGKIYITSQNHGYAVSDESIAPGLAKPLFINNNDGTNEGLQYLTAPAFSTQFHPEACGGPQDTGWLFDRFCDMMKGGLAHALEQRY